MTDGELDDLVRSAAMAEPIAAEPVEREIRHRLRPQRGRWYAAVAGAVAAAVVAGVWLTRPPREFRDAARDHRVEVVEHQPRHWKTDPVELREIEARDAIAAPEGFRLKAAKRCGIAGRLVTHLVYTDGVHDVSLYVMSGVSGRDYEAGGQWVHAFRTGRASGLIVGPPAECRQFANVIQRT
ncbi:MAG: hypothetical protein KGN84_16660 [Acidobacteriota bacterium]|nr:hypothetical protein [Acidobacteriota bacterium]